MDNALPDGFRVSKKAARQLEAMPASMMTEALAHFFDVLTDKVPITRERVPMGRARWVRLTSAKFVYLMSRGRKYLTLQGVERVSRLRSKAISLPSYGPFLAMYQRPDGPCQVLMPGNENKLIIIPGSGPRAKRTIAIRELRKIVEHQIRVKAGLYGHATQYDPALFIAEAIEEVNTDFQILLNAVSYSD